MEKEITEENMRQLFSKNLKRFRLSKNLSQLGLALDAGLTHNFINDLEKCKKGASFETIAKLSTALNVKPHLFFMSEDVADNTQIYINAFKDDLHRYLNNWTEPHPKSEQSEKEKK